MILQKFLYTQNKAFEVAVALVLTAFTTDVNATLMSHSVKTLVTMTETAKAMLIGTIPTNAK